ncbi:MAG: YdeI/OmpD-associated family protein [Acidobacteriia bacterium]|nr:YdeI/OmpD-associated family protein [Terriglobia bacterium]
MGRNSLDYDGARDPQRRYAVLHRIQTVKKAETRTRKIAQFIGMLEREETILSRSGRRGRQVATTRG